MAIARNRSHHARGGDGFQGPVTGALDVPFVVLFKQRASDEPEDAVVVGLMKPAIWDIFVADLPAMRAPLSEANLVSLAHRPAAPDAWPGRDEFSVL